MSGDRWIVDFDGEIEEGGRIPIPESVLTRLPARFGTLHVRLSGVNPMADLLARGVTNEEVDAVSKLQAANEEDVYRAFAAEGKLLGTSFPARFSGKAREREP